MITCWLGTCTDIDDQRRQSELLERLVRERTSELQRSNRQLEEFAAVASHDLQEPLRKIQAFSDRLRAKCGPLLGEQGNEYLDRILNSADRMRSLINDLLTISRVASGAAPFVPVDLAAVAREVISDLEGLIRLTGGHVELGPLPTVQADPLQMRQLFQNLIGNGLKFHYPDRAPVVRVTARPVEDPDIITGRPGHPGMRSPSRITGSGSRRSIWIESSGCSSVCMAAAITRGRGWGWPYAARSSSGTTGGSRRAGAGRGSTFLVTLPAHRGHVDG